MSTTSLALLLLLANSAMLETPKLDHVKSQLAARGTLGFEYGDHAQFLGSLPSSVSLVMIAVLTKPLAVISLRERRLLARSSSDRK